MIISEDIPATTESTSLSTSLFFPKDYREETYGDVRGIEKTYYQAYRGRHSNKGLASVEQVSDIACVPVFVLPVSLATTFLLPL